MIGGIINSFILLKRSQRKFSTISYRINMDWTHLYTNELIYKEPITLKAKVITGFQRGSKELGIPTANLNMEELGDIGSNLNTGIYFGWAKLNDNIYKTVVSVGWNPFYENKHKTIEAHLLHELDDFYDENLIVLLCGYLRDETNFNGVDELISCIKSDITKAESLLKENDSIAKYGIDKDKW